MFKKNILISLMSLIILVDPLRFAYAQSQISDSEKLYALSLIWKDIDYNFPFFSQIDGFNLDTVYREYLQRVTETTDNYEFYQLLQEFTALFNDCNTKVTLPQHYREFLSYPLIMFDVIEDKIVVKNIGLSQKETIPIGSLLLEVEGVTVDRYLLEKVYPYVSAGNDLVRKKKAVLTMFHGYKDQEIPVKFQRPDGTIIETKLVRNASEDRWSEITWETDLFLHRWLDDEILYINLMSFHDELIIRMFKSVMRELKSCRGLIIDLRINKRGRPDIAYEILKYLSNEKKIPGVKVKTRKNISLYKAFGTPIPMYNYVPPEEYVDYYEGNIWHEEDQVMIDNDVAEEKILVPIVVLTGTDVAGGAEDLLASLQAVRSDVIIVGENTSGIRGNVLIQQLPGWGNIWITTTKEFLPNGQILSRVGIRPDIEIKQTYDDFQKDVDTVLEKGLKAIKDVLKNY
jgi:carboxyl-terminal processing protease